MVCDLTTIEEKDVTNMSKRDDKLKKEIIDKIRATLARPTPSALMYGYLKEKDLNLKDMTVEQWKAIEMDLVEIVLAEVYPGEDIGEDQLNFTTLAHSIAFMSNFIETLNKNLNLSDVPENGPSGEEKKDSQHSDNGQDAGPKFEV